MEQSTRFRIRVCLYILRVCFAFVHTYRYSDLYFACSLSVFVYGETQRNRSMRFVLGMFYYYCDGVDFVGALTSM